ncbi:17179_t:CDS:2, partial [Racocetra persica]
FCSTGINCESRKVVEIDIAEIKSFCLFKSSCVKLTGTLLWTEKFVLGYNSGVVNVLKLILFRILVEYVRFLFAFFAVSNLAGT